MLIAAEVLPLLFGDETGLESLPPIKEEEASRLTTHYGKARNKPLNAKRFSASQIKKLVVAYEYRKTLRN